MWRSWLAHLLWEQGVVRSSRTTPTIERWRNHKLKKLQAIILIAACLFACKEQKQFAWNVNFETIEITRNDAGRKPDSLQAYRVNIKYLRPADAPARLRDSIVKATTTFFGAWFPSDTIDFNLNTAVKADMLRFLANADKVQTSSDYVGTRCFDLKVEPDAPYQNKHLISLIYRWSLYEGGAHGNHAKYCMNFDKSTGETITYGHLIKDEAALLAIVELEFRSLHGMTPDENMYSIYDFKKGQFQLSENFAFTVAGLAFYYNPYEIAPYSAGLIEFTIPYDKLKDCINFVE